MKRGERGYTLIELLIAVTVMALASGAAAVAIYQVLKNTEGNNDRLTVVRQVENAGYWISRDAQMALSANGTANLTLPDFLLLSWATWADNGTPTYHSARYYFADLADGVGRLKRTYASGTTSQTTSIAQHIYYDPSDVANTSNTSYDSPMITVKLTATVGNIMESREYQIKRRPNF